MSRFEDELWTELLSEHGPALAEAHRAAPRRSRTKPLAFTAGAFGVIGVATVATLALSSTATAPSAQAVTANHDGTVTVTLKDMLAVVQANKELNQLGVPIRVVPMQQGCVAPEPVLEPGRGDLRTDPVRNYGSLTEGVVIAPKYVPAGDTLVLAADELNMGAQQAITMSTLLVHGAVPQCVRSGVEVVNLPPGVSHRPGEPTGSVPPVPSSGVPSSGVPSSGLPETSAPAPQVSGSTIPSSR